MPKGISVLGVITARGGSQGIPRKNIAALLGKPLIAYTIAAAKESKLLTTCIVSTDNEEIANMAKDLGADVPFLRPAMLAKDSSKSIDVMAHALEWMEKNRSKIFDYAMILQPTSPLRTGEDIDATIRIAAQTGADSVMSMVELVDFSVPKLKRIKDNCIFPLFEEEGKESAHRNTGEPVFKRNTAIYLTKTELLRAGDMFGKNSRAYIMPRDRSIDINDAVDFATAESLLRLHKN
ncbi:hypothetical protein A2881_01005 [Candidatus Peribacteria bacterium RIFCSPHIGHO2_01_FULL_55_13]|nr:MAG: hypothetical protein A2881_01005 [Candidatus Peribacteria bacterium RIFCSPHIGHO2_01_FULL_55_13]OGJ65432.1 MAG: hypothetical protein A3F36_04960 [Candidatus Peribacteria bacterium RIFCSPHIGHO2_12_FULL_55_11]